MAVETPGPQGGKVLLMDDDDGIRDVTRQLLVRHGFTVDVARDGTEAIALYRQAMAANAPFDVVILDLSVPDGMGGEEALIRLREIDPGVKGVVSSGYCSDASLPEYLAKGFVGMVAKPYRIGELAARLRAIIQVE